MKEELEKFVKENGKVLLYMVHPNLYGPLKGVNGILKNPNIDELDSFLSDLTKQEEIIIKVWEKTGMSTQLMILPLEALESIETKPKEFETLKEVISFMEEVIDKAPTLAEEPFYFREGKL